MLFTESHYIKKNAFAIDGLLFACNVVCCVDSSCVGGVGILLRQLHQIFALVSALQLLLDLLGAILTHVHPFQYSVLVGC